MAWAALIGNELPVTRGIQPLGNAIEGIGALGRGLLSSMRGERSHEPDFSFSQTAFQGNV